MAVSIVSSNVNGLKTQHRCQTILNHLLGEKATFYFLQETHLNDADINKLKTTWTGSVAYSPSINNSGEVATLLPKDFKADIAADSGGRWVSARGIFTHLLVVHMTNRRNVDFFSTDYQMLLTPGKNEIVCLGGDFNMTTHPEDREQNEQKYNCRSRPALQRLLAKLQKLLHILVTL